MSECISFGEIESNDLVIDFNNVDPEKYNLINIEEDIFTKLYFEYIDEFQKIKTQVNELDKEYLGISLYGITVLSTKATQMLLTVLNSIQHDKEFDKDVIDSKISSVSSLCNSILENQGRLIIFGI